MNVLILGGTGVISRAIVDLLLEKEHTVTIFNRGNRALSFSGSVRQITGDREDRADFESRMRQESFDAVIDMICFNEADARSTVAAFKDNTDQIVICSSVAAYRRPYNSVPTVESAESLWDDPTFTYAFDKAQVERYLEEEVRSQQLPITIIRPSLTYGPGAANIGVLRQNFGIVDRIRKQKPLVMFGDGSTPWSFTFSSDLAKAFVGVLGNTQSHGQAYHACSEQRCRWEDLYLEFGKVVGMEPHIVHIPSELLCAANPDLFSHLYFEKLKRLPCNLVVDHVGRFMGPVPTNDPTFKVLLGFLETGRCWVKLSAPCESSESEQPDWADDEKVLNRILTVNPTELYGF